MSKELERVRELFLTDVDEETRQENLEQLNEWEQALVLNRAYASWQAHDITKEIAKKARETYSDASTVLVFNRELTDRQRHALWAKQDAALWLLSLTEQNAIETIQKVEGEIRQALKSATT